MTQERLAEKADLPRTKIVEVENGDNKATSWHIRAGLARGFGVRIETVAGLLDGVLTVAEVERRAKSGEAAEGASRLSARSEWIDVLSKAKAAAEVTDPDVRQEDFERVGTLYDGEAFPRPLTPKLLINLASALRRH
jgi:transcriptional regulator with XRE-family HTH domain